jgi:hypothetical protein
MRRIIPLIALLALSGCSLRRTWRSAPHGSGGATTELLIVGTGTGPPVVGISLEPASGPLCSPDDSDPAHTCPARAGPDPR